MKKENCKTDEIQEEEVKEVRLTEEEMKKFLFHRRIGAIIHFLLNVGLLVGLYLYFEENWFYTILVYVIGYYSLGALLRLIPNLGAIFYPGYRVVWDGHEYIKVDDPSYSKRYGLIELFTDFIYKVLAVIIVVVVSTLILPQYISIIAILTVSAVVLLQTLVFPLLNDLLAIIARRRTLQVPEKVETLTNLAIIALAVVTVIIMQFAYPPYTKPKMDIVEVFNRETPFYTQELLETAEVTYDYSHAATECDVTYVGKINVNNMIFDTETHAKLTFDAIDAVWKLQYEPNHKLLSDITVQKGKPAVFTGEQDIKIEGFEGEGIVTVKIIKAENGVGNGELTIHTLNKKKLLYSSKFTIEKAPLIGVDAGYRATMKKPLDVGYFSNASVDMSVDFSENNFSFYGWNFAF